MTLVEPQQRLERGYRALYSKPLVQEAYHNAIKQPILSTASLYIDRVRKREKERERVSEREREKERE